MGSSPHEAGEHAEVKHPGDKFKVDDRPVKAYPVRAECRATPRRTPAKVLAYSDPATAPGRGAKSPRSGARGAREPEQLLLENLRIGSCRSRTLCMAVVPIRGFEVLMAQEVRRPEELDGGLHAPEGHRRIPEQVQINGDAECGLGAPTDSVVDRAASHGISLGRRPQPLMGTVRENRGSEVRKIEVEPLTQAWGDGVLQFLPAFCFGSVDEDRPCRPNPNEAPVKREAGA